MKKKQRPAARWLAAALAALLAACAPLGRQPTVESEVIEPQADGAATAIDKVDDPDYEARIVTDFTGGSARMPDEDRTAPVGGGLSPDETVRRSAALLRAAGAALGGEWTLWLYPEELAGPVGSAPMYFV